MNRLTSSFFLRYTPLRTWSSCAWHFSTNISTISSGFSNITMILSFGFYPIFTCCLLTRLPMCSWIGLLFISCITVERTFLRSWPWSIWSSDGYLVIWDSSICRVDVCVITSYLFGICYTGCLLDVRLLYTF